MTKRLKGSRYLLTAMGLVFAASLLLWNQQANAQPPAAAPTSAATSAGPTTTAANDGFDRLPIGLKGLSSSTLVNMGRIRYAPANTAPSDGGRWANPFSPLLTIVWGAPTPTSGSAGEPAAGMHPTDPNRALVSGNFSLDNTTNGGTTWQTRNPPNACGSGDVVNTWLGPSFSSGNEALETCLNGSPIDFTCGRSTDGGVTWSTDAGCGPSVSTVFFDDRQYLWVDRSPTSPFSQRVYQTEALFDSGGTGSYNSVTLRWSSDGGHTWSPPGSNPLPIVDAAEFSRGISGNHNEFPSMGVQPNGTIGYAWHRGLCCGSSATVGSNNKVAFARSTDGGVTFPFSTTIVTVPQNQSVVFNSTSPLGVRWSDMPNITADPVDGTFYAIWTQYRTASTPASSAISLSKSTDNGNTWSTPVIPFNNPNGSIFQGWGWVSVTPDQTVHVTYLGGTTSNTAVAQFYVQSTDGGATWTAPFQLSSGTFGAFGTTTDYEANSVGGYTGGNAGSILAAWASSTHNARIGTFVLGPTSTPTSTATPCSPVPCTSTPTNTSTNTNTPTNTLPPTNTFTVTRTRTITPTRTTTLTPTITPTVAVCGPSSNYVIAQSTGASIVAGTTDTGNHGDDVNTAIALPFPFTLYGASFTTANVSSNGNLQFTSNSTAFTNACLPTATLNNAIIPHWDDLNTTNNVACPSGICGIFTTVEGSTPNRIFDIEWRATLFTGGGFVNFEARLYEATGEIDFVYGAVSGNGVGATIGVQRATGPQNTQFSCNTASLSTGLQLAFTQPPCGSPTATFTGTPPTSTFTNTPSNTPVPTFTPTRTNTAVPTATNTPPATCGPGSNYAITQATGAIVPGTTDSGNHGDDVVTNIPLPFTYNLYSGSFASVNASSNGNLQFTSANTAFTNNCLPDTTMTDLIAPHWDDLRTDTTGTCTPGPCGIYTSVSGSAPNRIFNIEWRAFYFSGAGTANFEVLLYEGQSRFDVVYGPVDQTGSSATVGVQNGVGPQNTQFECNTGGLTSGLALIFTQPPCGSPTATFTAAPPTNTFTPVPPTNTFTPIPPTNTFTPIPTATCPPVTVAVSIEDFDFNPQSITVNVGTTVRWTNTGGATHTSTSDTAVWDSGNLGTGQQFSFTFNSVGSFPYHCNIHPSMTGTINVIAGCAPTPTNTPLPTNTFTNTPIPTNTNTNTPTNTPVPPTNTPINTNTSVPTNTNTPTPANINAYAHFQTPGPGLRSAPSTPVLSSITVTLGSRVDLGLFVNAGSNSVNAAQSYLTFTNSIIQNVNVGQPGCVLTSTVTGDLTTFEAVLQNETCNGPGNCVFRAITVGPGSMAYASGALSNCPGGCTGDFRVAQVAFCTIATGDALVHWQFAPPAPVTRDSEIVDNNSNVVSNRALYTDLVIHVLSAPTPTNTPVSVLVGHVTWQGRPTQPNALQALPITLTLKSGAGETNYAGLTTDASGFFTVPVGTLPNGGYNWRVKGPDGTIKTLATDPCGFLANSGTLTLSGTQTTQQEMGLMRAGDANNDNVVNISDDNILKNSFGRTVGQPGYDNRADFNGDQTVNALDFNLMRNNFGQAGQPPLGPGNPVLTGDKQR